MKGFLKKALTAAARMIAVLFFFGGALVFAAMVVSLTWPPYAQHAFWAFAAAALAAAVLAAGGFLPGRGLRWLGGGLLAVLAACLVYYGWGTYNAQIPTVDDRTLLLWEYEPFQEGTKAVSPEEPAAFHMDGAAALRLRLDGATALYPVYASFVQTVYPEDDYPLYNGPYAGRVACTNTVGAYQRLIDRDVDMIFAAAPSQAQQEAAERAGLELHMTPIGREAFVFFVNSKNPVTGLTVEQIQGIYSGRITNWKEVGGRNQSIRPFQRAEDSGSQSALQRLMGDIPLLEPEKEDRLADMGGIIREVASYRNYKNAIGFSFRFYATEMAANDEIRLLALNGVEPAKETVRDGSYPAASAFYAVTASPKGQPAPEETDGDLGALLDWILSPQGQAVVEAAGYVAVS